jgi:hypothetical protein
MVVFDIRGASAWLWKHFSRLRPPSRTHARDPIQAYGSLSLEGLHQRPILKPLNPHHTTHSGTESRETQTKAFSRGIKTQIGPLGTLCALGACSKEPLVSPASRSST